MHAELRAWTMYVWVGVGLVWLIAGLSVKRIERGLPAASRLADVLLMGLAFVLIFNGRIFAALGQRLTPDTNAVVGLGFVLTLAGALLAVWARLQLGRNWSGVVALKTDHALVDRGPYAVVRHPLYSGLLLAVLGTTLVIGETRSFLGLGVALFAFWRRIELEEKLLIEQFGAAYVDYRRRTRALIPFVL